MQRKAWKERKRERKKRICRLMGFTGERKVRPGHKLIIIKAGW